MPKELSKNHSAVFSVEMGMIKDTRMPSGGNLRKATVLNDFYC